MRYIFQQLLCQKIDDSSKEYPYCLKHKLKLWEREPELEMNVV